MTPSDTNAGVHHRSQPGYEIQPSIVPDNVIPPQPDKYWAPHPQTGVFGPAAEHSHTAGGKDGSSPVDIGEEASVLEQLNIVRCESVDAKLNETNVNL
ncbi:unnamed protein product [Prunus armeniaca]|uniref:Uncharacterized protein n=1 Tax=Prunus armeniaca TaxID=36596 RepID=A0A6J5UBS7_PRUAR|nr:unnamed protein product [Prunus armeniaca]